MTRLTAIALAATLVGTIATGTPALQVEGASKENNRSKVIIIDQKDPQKDFSTYLKQYGVQIYNWNNCIIPGFPGIDKPEIDKPEIDKPGTDKPEIDNPGTDKPEIDNPDDNTDLSYIKQVANLVNKERAKAGLSPLTVKKDIESAAKVRAIETQKSFSHTRPNGSKFTTALTESNVTFKGAGENIAWGQKTPEQVMDVWMNSEGHRANILNKNFTSIGVGYETTSSGTPYWVQLFTY